MLTATVKDRSIAVSGHALFAPKGKDLVCAAVSGIVLGTRTIFRGGGMRVDRRNARVTLRARAGEPHQLAALEVVRAQLEEVAKSYPEHIRIIRE